MLLLLLIWLCTNESHMTNVLLLRHLLSARMSAHLFRVHSPALRVGQTHPRGPGAPPRLQGSLQNPYQLPLNRLLIFLNLLKNPLKPLLRLESTCKRGSKEGLGDLRRQHRGQPPSRRPRCRGTSKKLKAFNGAASDANPAIWCNFDVKMMSKCMWNACEMYEIRARDVMSWGLGGERSQATAASAGARRRASKLRRHGSLTPIHTHLWRYHINE